MSPSKYHHTLDYLYAKLPMFQHVGPVAYKANLNNITALCKALGNPHLHVSSVHVGGTNGKGSSCHMIAAILQCAGYKTGLYTSPHLKNFTERIKINGREIKKMFVVDFVKKNQLLIEQLRPSFFEVTVAMAFAYFAFQLVDLNVIEVGLGGMLDSTNIIDPNVSLITRIDYDHQPILGETLSLIANQKMGIIKPGRMAVISERQPDLEDIFIRKARDVNASLRFAQDIYGVREDGEYTEVYYTHTTRTAYRFKTALQGAHQRRNVVGVLGVIDALVEVGYSISKQAVEQGMSQVVPLTGLKGRWQKIADNPLTYCDIAHNKNSIQEMVSLIKKMSFEHLHIVLGISQDKHITSIFSNLPINATYYFCQANLPRAMPAEVIRRKAGSLGFRGVVVPDSNKALAKARKQSSPNDLIVVSGSAFVVSEIKGL